MDSFANINNPESIPTYSLETEKRNHDVLFQTLEELIDGLEELVEQEENLNEREKLQDDIAIIEAEIKDIELDMWHCLHKLSELGSGRSDGNTET